MTIMKYMFATSGLVSSLLLFGAYVSLAHAQTQVIDGRGPTQVIDGRAAPGNSVSTAPALEFKNPINVNSICGLIKKILAFVLAIGMPIAALFLVYAGFKFVLARGNPAALQKARENILYVVIGIAIFSGAWLLGQVVANTLSAISPQNEATARSCS